MKRYFDYEQEELAELTDEDVKTLIELEIAHEGIMPIPCPEKPDLENAGITKCVRGFQIGSLICKNEEDAITISGMELLTDNYNYTIGYDYKWLDPILNPKITEVYFYKQDDISRVASVLQDIERKKKVYENEKNKYDSFIAKTGKIRDSVWSSVTKARKFEEKVGFAKEIYEKHLTLAEGSEEIAQKFFRDAYEGEEDIVKRVLG